MKKLFTLLSLSLIYLFGQNAFAASAKSALPSHETVPASSFESKALESANAAKEEWKNLSRKDKRLQRKAMKKDIKQAVKDWKDSGSGDTNLLLLVIIAILLPPLAMALYDGITKRFWISLLLTLLFYVPGLIYTLYVILSEN